MEVLSEELELWLLHWEFDSLNKKQQNVVLKQMTAVEYQQYRSVLVKANQAFAKNITQPSDNVLQNLQNAMQDKQHEHKLVSLLKYSVPLYQCGIAAAILLAAWLFWPSAEVPSGGTPKTVYVYKTDTVTIVKNMPPQVHADKYSSSNKKQQAQVVEIKPFAREEMSMGESPFPATNMQVKIADEGRSLQEDSLLTSLLVAAK